jgi:hypothetical protein
MSFLWEGVKQMSQMAGAAALLAGQKTKLRGEIMLVEREAKTRQQTFGVELYDFVAPLAKSPDFFAANDQMTDVIRGPFLGAQREIAALMIKRGKLKEELAQAEVARKAAFPAPATTFGEQVLNTGKATAFTANEVKIKTEISMVDAQIRSHKEDFGEVMFDIFVKLEDEQGWLPTVRDIRTMYDKARQDVDRLKAKIDAKEREFATLGTEGDVAAANFTTTATSSSSVSGTTYGSSSQMASTSAHSRPSPLGPQLVVNPAPAPVPALHPASTNTLFPESSFGASPQTTATPSPAMAQAASTHHDMGSLSDPYRRPPAAPMLEAPSAVSGLFLGLTGDSSSAAAPSGGTYGIRRQSQVAVATSISDPFAMDGGGGSSSGHDPFAPVPHQQRHVDPFDSVPSSQQPPVAAPNDPFSFSSQSSASAPVTAAAPLPYDPFAKSVNGSSYDDPFADLVASGRR